MGTILTIVAVIVIAIWFILLQAPWVSTAVTPWKQPIKKRACQV